MRRLITGVDASGHSCVVEEAPISLEEAGLPGMASATVASTSSAPPPCRPEGRGQFVELSAGPGLTGWLMLQYGPGCGFPMHHTDTVDFDLVLEGTMELGLDDGTHVLEAGDMVVMNGVDHSWTAGPSGCRMTVFFTGTPPPA
jgi:quercetin dioxygenase-like cupin family protein